MSVSRIIVVAIIFGALVSVFTFPKLSKATGLAKFEEKITNKTAALKDSKKSVQKIQNFTNTPTITAKSAVIVDASSGEILFEKDSNIRLLPASTTKLMTALVAQEQCPTEKIITVDYVEPEPNSMGLAKGDMVTAQTLLYGLLVFSANDASYALAQGCSTNLEDFVRQMNRMAKQIGMHSTHFANPAGFDDKNQYSTAKDLALLAKVAVANPLISKIVATQSIVLTDTKGVKTYYLENINKLLGTVSGVEGVKTGKTDGAQEILLTKVTRSGNTVIISLLSSQDRFGESEDLIEWTFNNYVWRN